MTLWPPLRLLLFPMQIGEGKAVYDAAVAALKAWEHLQLGALLLLPPVVLLLPPVVLLLPPVVDPDAAWCPPSNPNPPLLPPTSPLSDSLLPPCSAPCTTGWNSTTTPPAKVGATLCSATQTVVPWSVLPAQVVYSKEGTAQFGLGDSGESAERGEAQSSTVQLRWWRRRPTASPVIPPAAPTRPHPPPPRAPPQAAASRWGCAR